MKRNGNLQRWGMDWRLIFCIKQKKEGLKILLEETIE